MYKCLFEVNKKRSLHYLFSEFCFFGYSSNIDKPLSEHNKHTACSTSQSQIERQISLILIDRQVDRYTDIQIVRQINPFLNTTNTRRAPHIRARQKDMFINTDRWIDRYILLVQIQIGKDTDRWIYRSALYLGAQQIDSNYSSMINRRY